MVRCFGKYKAESPKQDSKRFNSITKTGISCFRAMRRERLFPPILNRSSGAAATAAKWLNGCSGCCCHSKATATEYAIAGVETTSQLVSSSSVRHPVKLPNQTRKGSYKGKSSCHVSGSWLQLTPAVSRIKTVAATGGWDRAQRQRRQPLPSPRMLSSMSSALTSSASVTWIFHLSLLVVQLQQQQQLRQQQQQQQQLRQQPQQQQLRQQSQQRRRPGLRISVCACGPKTTEKHRQVHTFEYFPSQQLLLPFLELILMIKQVFCYPRNNCVYKYTKFFEFQE